MRTDPKRFLFRMMLFLVVVGVICAALFGPLKTAFLGNPALNSVILATLGLGILYVIRQTLRLTPERKWLLSIQKTGSLDTPDCLLYTSPSPRDRTRSRMPSSA